MSQHLSDQDADDFFAVVFRGINHAPKRRRDADHTVSVSAYAPYGLSTYDYDELTRFVLLCHERCYRGVVAQSGPRHVRLSITKRARENDNIAENHPTIEEAVAHLRGGSERQWVPRKTRTTSGAATEPNRWLDIAEHLADPSNGWKP